MSHLANVSLVESILYFIFILAQKLKILDCISFFSFRLQYRHLSITAYSSRIKKNKLVIASLRRRHLASYTSRILIEALHHRHVLLL